MYNIDKYSIVTVLKGIMCIFEYHQIAKNERDGERKKKRLTSTYMQR